MSRETPAGIGQQSPDPNWEQRSAKDNRNGHRSFSDGSRREEEACRSLQGVLAKTHGTFNRELYHLAKDLLPAGRLPSCVPSTSGESLSELQDRLSGQDVMGDAPGGPIGKEGSLGGGRGGDAFSRYDQPAAAEDWNSRRRPSGGISGNTGGTSRTQSGSLLGRLPPGSLLPGNTGSLNVSPTRAIFLSPLPPTSAAAAAAAARCLGDERSASYMGNIDGGAPGTPVARSRSMAAGMDEASYQRMARGGVRKRFTALKAGKATRGETSSLTGHDASSPPLSLTSATAATSFLATGGRASGGVQGNGSYTVSAPPERTTGSFFPGWFVSQRSCEDPRWAYGGGGEAVFPDLGQPLPPQTAARARAVAPAAADPNMDSSPFRSREEGMAGLSPAGDEGGGGEGAATISMIVDVIVAHGSDAIPQGYTKILKSSGGRRADLNSGSMGQYVYLAVKREPGESSAASRARKSGVPNAAGGVYTGRVVGMSAVVALALIFPDRGETVPPLFQKVRRRGQPVDLNHGTNGERSFLCYKRGTTNPITDIQIYFPRKREVPPHGYHRLDHSPGGTLADINSGSGGAPIFLAYKQELVCLRALRSGVSYACLESREAISSTRETTRSESASSAFASNEGVAGGSEGVAGGEGRFDVGGRGSGRLRPRSRPVLNGSGGSWRPEHGIDEQEGMGTVPETSGRGSGGFVDTTGVFPPEAGEPKWSPGVGTPPKPLQRLGPTYHQADQAATPELEHPPFSNDQHDEDAHVLSADADANLLEEASAARGATVGLLGDGWESRRTHRLRSSMGKGGSVFELSGVFDSVGSTTEGEDDGEGNNDHDEGDGRGCVMDDVVDGEGHPVSYRLRDAVFLLLAGVYVRHGNASQSCMMEVTRLLTQTAFFHGDMKVGVGAGLGGVTGKGRGRTLLDFAVEAMCDSLDHVAEERFPFALTFFEALVRTSEGRLGPLALQRAFLGLSFLCSYACSSKGWVQAGLGDRGPLRDSDPALRTLKNLLKLVCRQVEIAEETRAALRRSRSSGAGVSGQWAAPTPATMVIPTWDTYTPMVRVKNGGDASWVITPDHGSGASWSYDSSTGNGEEGRGRTSIPHHPLPAPSPLATDKVHAFVSELVREVVGSAVDMVELAKIMETVLDVVKRHSSHSSETFWRDVGDFGAMLFGERRQAHVSAFVMLAALCKMATGMLRTLADGELVARDLGNKILALDMIHTMLRSTGEYFRSNRIFGYQVRRLVASVVLANASDALLDGRCFRRTLMVVSELWRGFRTHCKVELAILLEGFLLKTLRATSPQMPAMWRVTVLEELITWFDGPNSLVELFLNYDMDRKFIQQWKIFEQTCNAFCAIAEGRGEDSDPRGDSEAEKALGKLRLTALRSLSQVMKRLMDAAGHGHVMSIDKKTRDMSLARSGGWEAPEGFAPGAGSSTPLHGEMSSAGGGGGRSGTPGTETDVMNPEESRILLGQAVVGNDSRGGGGGGDSLGLLPPQPGDGSVLSPVDSMSSSSATGTRAESLRSASGSVTTGAAEGPHRRRTREPNSFKYCKELRNRAEEVVTQALKLYATKGLKKAVQYLVASNFISDTPRDIANFLRIYRKDLDPLSIGEFLSEPDVNNGDYWKAIRLQYVRAISFHGKTLEEALRHLLTDSGFRLPGESQKVDRLLSAFAECYIADNRDNPSCPFTSTDTPFILSFAIIMLNTDLHRANAGTGKRRRRRMTKEDFINNLRGVIEASDVEKNLSRSYLGNIYDTIERRPIEMLLESEEVKGSESKEPHLVDPCAFARELSKAALGGEELLRALAMFGHRFSLVGVDTTLSLDLVKLMFQSVSMLMHDVVNSVLDRTQPDVDSVLASLDIVRYSLGCSIFLGMTMEKAAFAQQLPKFWILTNRQEERIALALSAATAAVTGSGVGPGTGSSKASSASNSVAAVNAPTTGTTSSPSAASGDGSLGRASSTSFSSDVLRAGGSGGGGGLLGTVKGVTEGDVWLDGVENVEHAGVEAESTLAQVHSLVSSLEQRVNEAYIMEELHSVARRIRNHSGLFDGTPRRFLREGDLIKFSRNGSRKTYRFFLFSDQLVYAHHLFSGDWKMHGQLLLALVKVVDLKDKEDCKFMIQHPKKSFTVSAKTVWNKRAWMSSISSAAEAVLRARLEGVEPSSGGPWTTSRRIIPQAWAHAPGIPPLSEPRYQRSKLGLSGRPLKEGPQPSSNLGIVGVSEGRTVSSSSSVSEASSRPGGFRSAAAAAAAAAVAAARVGGGGSSASAASGRAWRLTVDTEAANKEAGQGPPRYVLTRPSTSKGSALSSRHATLRPRANGGDAAAATTGAASSFSSSASAPSGVGRDPMAGVEKTSAVAASATAGGAAGEGVEVSGSTRVTTFLSPASSSGTKAGSLATPRDSANQQRQQAGTPRSVSLISMRSRLIKRWNSSIVGTPVSSGSSTLSPSAFNAAAPEQKGTSHAFRASAGSPTEKFTSALSAAGVTGTSNGGRSARKVRDPPEPSAAPPPAPASFWGEKAAAHGDRRSGGRMEISSAKSANLATAAGGAAAADGRSSPTLAGDFRGCHRGCPKGSAAQTSEAASSAAASPVMTVANGVFVSAISVNPRDASDAAPAPPRTIDNGGEGGNGGGGGSHGGGGSAGIRAAAVKDSDGGLAAGVTARNSLSPPPGAGRTTAAAAAASAASAAASAVAAASTAASAAVSAAASAASTDTARTDSDLLDRALIAPPTKGLTRPGSGKWPGLTVTEASNAVKAAGGGRGHEGRRGGGSEGGGGGVVGARAQGPPMLLASSGSWSEAPDDQALTKKFRISLMFYTKELMANAKQYGEGDKLALYGLFKQAKWGDCPAGLVSAQRDDPVGSVKVRAWVTNRGKPTSQAMQEFIAVLCRVAPGWESRVVVPGSISSSSRAASPPLARISGTHRLTSASSSSSSSPPAPEAPAGGSSGRKSSSHSSPVGLPNHREGSSAASRQRVPPGAGRLEARLAPPPPQATGVEKFSSKEHVRVI